MTDYKSTHFSRHINVLNKNFINNYQQNPETVFILHFFRKKHFFFQPHQVENLMLKGKECDNPTHKLSGQKLYLYKSISYINTMITNILQRQKHKAYYATTT